MNKTTHYKGHLWTDDELTTMMQMWQSKNTVEEIAAHLNCGNSAVSKMVVRLRANGIPLERRNKGHVAGRKNSQWSQGEVEYLLRRRLECATSEQIGTELGRTFNSVSAMIQKLRSEQVPVGMLGNGVRRLWSVDKLKAMMINRSPEDTKVIQLEQVTA